MFVNLEMRLRDTDAPTFFTFVIQFSMSVKLAERSTLDIEKDILFYNVKIQCSASTSFSETLKKANVELECKAGTTFRATLKKGEFECCAEFSDSTPIQLDIRSFFNVALNVLLAQHSSLTFAFFNVVLIVLLYYTPVAQTCTCIL